MIPMMGDVLDYVYSDGDLIRMMQNDDASSFLYGIRSSSRYKMIMINRPTKKKLGTKRIPEKKTRKQRKAPKAKTGYNYRKASDNDGNNDGLRLRQIMMRGLS